MSELTRARSRRSVLAGAAGTALGAVVGSLASATHVAAANGDVVHVGDSLSATSETMISLSGALPGDAAVHGDHPSGLGIHGSSQTQPGVYGYSDSSTGVVGISANGNGVDGATQAAGGGVGLCGRSFGATGTGVLGISGDVALSGLVAPKTGVLGYADADTAALGVHGKTTVGQGVRGDATSGTGVLAAATTGTALQVNGKAKFSRSGRKAITATHSSVRVTMAGVTTASYVVATLQTYRSGVYVAAAVPTAGSFTIYLNKAVAATTYVGFLVIN